MNRFAVEKVSFIHLFEVSLFNAGSFSCIVKLIGSFDIGSGSNPGRLRSVYDWLSLRKRDLMLVFMGVLWCPVDKNTMSYTYGELYLWRQTGNFIDKETWHCHNTTFLILVLIPVTICMNLMAYSETGLHNASFPSLVSCLT